MPDGQQIEGKSKCWRLRMTEEKAGNLDQVRSAIHGITGVAPVEAAAAGPDRYLIMARMNHELDTVDSFRRNNVPAYWPSYEELAPSRRRAGGA
jgi:hypothetical protein